jgi:hypothetical protein
MSLWLLRSLVRLWHNSDLGRCPTYVRYAPKRTLIGRSHLSRFYESTAIAAPALVALLAVPGTRPARRTLARDPGIACSLLRLRRQSQPRA